MRTTVLQWVMSRNREARSHLFADAFVIFAFTLAPKVLAMETGAATLSLCLALAHTMLTAFAIWPPRRWRAMSASIHGGTEIAVAALLVLASPALPWSASSRLFFGVIGMAILIVWWRTDYRVVAQWSREE